MAEAATTDTPTLSEQYLLKEKEQKPDGVSKPVEVKADDKPATVFSEEVLEKAEETPAPAAEEKTEDIPVAAEESTEPPTAAESNSEDASAAAEENNETTEENSVEQEAGSETREIKLETAPGDYRFPTTNQTRHCFTRYIEYHRCVAAKGEDAPECDKFAKYYRSLCPAEWVERWNEQREQGTFPGPL